MPYFSFLNNTKWGSDDLDFAITDLQVVDDGASTYLITANKATDGGIVSYSIQSDGSLAKGGRAFAGTEGLPGVGPNLMVANSGNIYLAGTKPGDILSYQLNTSGAFEAPTSLTGIPADRPNLPLIASAGNYLALATPREDGVAIYTANGEALSNRVFVDDIRRSHLASPAAVLGATVGGNDFVIVASQSEQGLSVLQVNSDSPRLRETIGADSGVPMMTPTTMTLVESNGKTYVIVGSAPTTGTSGALTVFELDSNGSLTLTDHLQDTLDTRFGLIQTVDSFVSNGRTYVAAAGGDQGLSLFGVMDDGRLIHLESIEDRTEYGLGGATAVEFAEIDQSLYLFATATSEGGVSGFGIDQQNPGQTLYGQDSDDTFTGGDGSDWLFGAGGNDTLSGGAGADILSDGAGVDTLTGDAGEDLFVLSNDNQEDRITDFNPTEDKIDLSGWAYLQSTDTLDITASEGGYRIRYRGETLYIAAAAGVTLDADSIRDAIVLGGNRIWEPPSLELVGTDENDTLTGSWGADSLNGGAGDDTLEGGAGDDILIGGDGNDIFYGGDGDDQISGGSGTDIAFLDVNYDSRTYLSIEGTKITIRTSEGLDVFEDVEFFQFNDQKIAAKDLTPPIMQGSEYADVLVGTPSIDIIHGLGGDDIIKGIELSDTLDGGEGNDEMYGGRHGDLIYGQKGNDFVHGNGGNDKIYGGEGDDTLRGGSRRDTLFGEDGNDRLYGNNFADTLDGGKGNDILKGGGGDDILTGGAGDDFLKGGKDADTFKFKKGDGMDRIVDFKPGQDIIDLSDDLWSGGDLNKIAAVTGDGVLLTFSATDTITLMKLSTLDGLADSII